MEKAELRAAGMQAVEDGLRDRLRATEKERYMLEGATVGYDSAIAVLEHVLGQVDVALDKGQFPNGLEDAKHAKDWLVTALRAVDSKRTGARSQVMVAEGKLHGLRIALQDTERRREAEMANAKRVQEELLAEAEMLEEAMSEDGGVEVEAPDAPPSVDKAPPPAKRRIKRGG